MISSLSFDVITAPLAFFYFGASHFFTFVLELQVCNIFDALAILRLDALAILMHT